MDTITSIMGGLLVGIIARFLIPGQDSGRFIITIALGLVGSFIGGFFGRTPDWHKEGQPAGRVV